MGPPQTEIDTPHQAAIKRFNRGERREGWRKEKEKKKRGERDDHGIEKEKRKNKQ